MKLTLCLIFCSFFAFPLIARVSTLPQTVTISEGDDAAIPDVLVPYRIKKLWGFSDMKGNIKILPQYDEVKQIKYYWTDGASFQNVMVVKKGGKLFAINHHNKVVVAADAGLDEINPDYYYYNVSIVARQGKKGVFYNGKQIVPCIYNNISRDKNLSFRVLMDGKSGIINSKGKIIVPVEYYGMHVIGNADKQHVTWVAGKDSDKSDEFPDDLVVDPGTSESHSYSVRMESPVSVRMEKSERDTLLRRLRKTYPGAIMDREYNYLIYITQNKKWGVFNVLAGKQTVPYEYDELGAEKGTSPKIAIHAKKAGMYGYIDEDNNILAPFILTGMSTYYVNFKLYKSQKIGLLTGSGLQYIAPKYTSIEYSDEVYDAAAEKVQSFFQVTTVSGQLGYVNASGFEYFKD